jgi:hypothetical protein
MTHFPLPGYGAPTSTVIDPPAPIPGTTPTVYPGAIAVGQDEEALFNVWMDRYFDMPLARQKGETLMLGQKVKTGIATPLEKRQYQFARDLRLGDLEEKEKAGTLDADEKLELINLREEGAGVPELKLAEGERVQVIEEQRIVGVTPKMGVALALGIGFIGLLALAKRSR